MDKQVRFISLISALLVVILMISTTSLQFFRADDLSANGWNTRAIYNEFGKARGAIIVKNSEGAPKNIAYSEHSDDAFKYQRLYPESPIYSPITGFFSIANRADRGIEAAMNDELNGDIPEMAMTNFTDFIMQKEKKGGNVVLTVNDDLQIAVANALNATGLKGAVVAIEPSSGRILALASTPSIDANAFAVHDTGLASLAYTNAINDENDPLYNRALDEIYPPGSTFKLITSAAAIESGKYSPETIVDSPLTYVLPGTATALPNANGGNCAASNGKETMARALEMSCNTAFAIIGNDLGIDAMSEQAKKFGVGDTMSIAGVNAFQMQAVKSQFPEKATDDRLAMDSIGQGETMLTPLQDCLISAAIANSGTLMKPYIVEEVENANGETVRTNFSSQYGQVVKESTAKQLAEMMYGNVARGVASNAAVRGVKVAGKTGTAENVIGQNPHSWFTGYAPLDNPKIAISVFLQNGSGVKDAAKIASTLFGEYIYNENGGQK